MGALVEHAKLWGAMKHKEQVRKYTGESYFTHCEAVAGLVQEFYEEVLLSAPPEAVLAAALLHDVVEDTDATFDMVTDIAGEEVAKYVYYLTKPPEFAGNRSERKAIYNSKLALAPDQVKVIKFCDMLHNHKSIMEHDKVFWQTWRRETTRAITAMEIAFVHNGDLLEWAPEFVTNLSA